MRIAQAMLTAALACPALFGQLIQPVQGGGYISAPGRFVVAAPSGRPLLVQGPNGVDFEAGESFDTWHKTVTIFADAQEELYALDDLTFDGIEMDAHPYKLKGIYPAYIYGFFKRGCAVQPLPGHENDSEYRKTCSAIRYARYFVEVDTRRNTVKTLQQDYFSGDGTVAPVAFAGPPNAVLELSGSVSPKFCSGVKRLNQPVETAFVVEVRKYPNFDWSH